MYGKIVSKITEDLFDEGGDFGVKADGTNQTGTYSIAIKIKKYILQLIPFTWKKSENSLSLSTNSMHILFW